MKDTVTTDTGHGHGVYREDRGINKFYVICGIVICLCAIAEFILWIIDAGKMHMPNQVIMGSGFLTLSAGVLLYLLVRNKSYLAANWLLWVSIIACIALFFVGIAVTPSVTEAAGVLGAMPE